MKTIWRWSALGLVLALLAAPAAGELVLARVDGEPITEEELKTEFVERHGGHAKFLLGVIEIRKFLDQVVNRRLLLQEAYRLGIDALPAVRESVADYETSRAGARMIEVETRDKVEVTEEAVRDAWERHTAKLYQVQNVVVESRAEAEAIHAELVAGADMAKLAQERSLARSRAFGGMMATIGWGTMPPSWEAQVFALAPGELSPPFESSEGWEIARLVEQREVDRSELAAASSRIQGILENRQLEARRAALLDELMRKNEAQWGDTAKFAAVELERLAASEPGTKLASWRGGAMELGAFAAGHDLAALAGLPPTERKQRLRSVLEQRLLERLAGPEAVSRGYASDPKVVSEVRIFREKLMEGALYADHVLRGLAVSEDDVRRWYEENRETYREPEMRQVGHIVATDRESAEALRLRIAAGEAFEEIARQASKDVMTAGKGGDLGWISVRQVPTEFRAVLALAEGGVSEPIQSQFGWHLLRVAAIRPGRLPAFDEVRERIEKELFERRKTERRADWVARLREAVPVEIDQAAIDALAAQSPDELDAPAPSHGPDGGVSPPGSD